MKLFRFYFFAGAAFVIGSMLLIESCKEDEEHYPCDPGCTACQRIDSITGFCNCVPDTSIKCPSELLHATYDYSTCTCNCEKQWTGALCDQRDTNYYISFRFGSDTSALSGVIRTSNYTLLLDTWIFYGLRGSVPPDAEIDFMRLTHLPTIPTEKDTSYPLCETAACIHLEAVFDSSGATAFPVSGIVTVDSVIPYTYLGGTFKANLHIPGTGQNYYMREGRYSLPYF